MSLYWGQGKTKKPWRCPSRTRLTSFMEGLFSNCWSMWPWVFTSDDAPGQGQSSAPWAEAPELQSPGTPPARCCVRTHTRYQWLAHVVNQSVNCRARKRLVCLCPRDHMQSSFSSTGEEIYGGVDWVRGTSQVLTETSDGHTLTKPVHEGPARPQLGRRYAQCAQWEQLLRRGLKTVCIASSNQSLQKEGEKFVNTLPLKVLLSTTSHFSLNCLRSSQEALILGNLSVIPS